MQFIDGMIVSHLPYGPTAYFNLSNCVMRHDIPNVGTMSEAYPHLIFHSFRSKLGQRVRKKFGYVCLAFFAKIWDFHSWVCVKILG